MILWTDISLENINLSCVFHPLSSFYSAIPKLTKGLEPSVKIKLQISSYKIAQRKHIKS